MMNIKHEVSPIGEIVTRLMNETGYSRKGEVAKALELDAPSITPSKTKGGYKARLTGI